MFFFKNKHESKIEDMRNSKIDARLNDYTFKPKLSKIAQQVGKRTVEDLYVNLNYNFRIGNSERRKT